MLRIVCLLLLLPLAACQWQTKPTNAVELRPLSNEERQQYRAQAEQLFEEYYQFELEQSPVLRSRLGLHGQFEWDDLSQEARDQRTAYYQELRQQLQAIREDALDAPTLASYRTLLAQLEHELLLLPFQQHGYEFSQLHGWHTEVVDVLINHHPVSSIAEVQDYITRLQGIPALFNRWQENISAAEEQGIVPPAFVFEPVQQSIAAITRGEPFDTNGISPLWADFSRKLDALQLYPSTRALLERRARSAMQQQVLPAYKRLQKQLQELARRAPAHQSAADLDDGLRYYQLQLGWYSDSNADANQIHQLGLTEVSRIQQEIRQLMPALGYTGERQNLSDFFRWMEERSERFSNDDLGRDAFLGLQRTRLQQLAERLPWYFTQLPQTPLAIRMVEDYRQSNTPVAFYQPPALDGSRPGLYYVNPTRLNDLPRYRLAALAFHEALPGHHLQISLAQENEQLPPFRRILHSPAFTEGWALYAEKLAGEMGVYEGPQEEYGRLVQELWRAVRLVLDTGLHAKGWSREQALQYQLDNTPFSATDTNAMISRYLVLPGQAVAYSMGEQRLWSIRRAIQNRLGSRFDLARFHTALLSGGSMPLDVLEEQMKLWAGQQR